MKAVKSAIIVKVTVVCIGMTEIATKETGPKDRLMAWEPCTTMMAGCSMDYGRTDNSLEAATKPQMTRVESSEATIK